MKPPRAALVAGGVDPTGGAGLAIDISFLARLGVRVAPLVTALTVQDDSGVRRIEPIDQNLLIEMAAAALTSVRVSLSVMKTGLVPTVELATTLAAIARDVRVPLVVDPILAAGTGDSLHRGDPQQVIAPLVEAATLLLPNLDEAQQLSGIVWDGSLPHLMTIARALSSSSRTVAVSGGHVPGSGVPMAIAGPAGETMLEVSRVAVSATHGTGCALAASAAGYIAQGLPPGEAAAAAHRFIATALAASKGLPGTRLTPEPWTV